MYNKRFIIPVIILSLFFVYGINLLYYRDKVPFICPVEFEGKIMPIRNDSYGEGHFGAKRKDGRLHKGVDILAEVNTPVRAAKSGWAVSGRHPKGYGRFVKIAHSGGLMTIYAHLKETNVKWIKKVRQGDVIGFVGKTGNANYKGIKPHLHFEVRKGGIPVDPLKGYIR